MSEPNDHYQPQVILLEMRRRTLAMRWWDFCWSLYGYRLYRFTDWRRNRG